MADDPVTAYAKRIASGDLPSGKWHRLACERHLKDLDDQNSRWEFKPKLAAKAFGIFKLFRHYKGREWAGKPITLEPWQQFIVGSIMGWVEKETGLRRFRNAFIELPRGSGKALAVDTPIATPDGWVRHGDLKAGDVVFAPSGKPVAVQAATGHYSGPCMTLETSDLCRVVAHERHEWDTHRTWYTKRPKGPKGRCPLPTVETIEIAKTIRCGARGDLVHRIDVAGPLECEHAELPVPPYTLGAWLGDGHSSCSKITCADVEIIDRIRSEGVPVTEKDYTGQGKAKTYALTDGDRTQKARNVCLAARMRALGVLNNKHIPMSYLRASAGQRLEVLRGIVDTDGHIAQGGQIEITLTNERLALDTRELISTLGHKPTMCADRAMLKGRDVGPRYRIRFFQLTNEAVATIPRKRDRLRKATSFGKRRTVVSAEPCGQHAVNCIQVEGGRYLAGRGLVPTHNSTIAGGMLVLLTFFDGESGAEGYSFATKKDQARITFQAGRQMVLRSHALKEHIEVSKYNLHSLATESKMEALGSDSDTLDGLRPNCAIADEVHRHPSASLIEVMESGMGTRSQPLLFEITTAGEDDTSVYGQHFLLSTRVLERTVELDEWFCFIASADQEDDWTQEPTWIKANPNYNVSVKPEFLRKECKKALANPAEQAKFRRLYLGQKVQALEGYFSLDDWKACPELPEVDELRKYPCWIGLDLSSSIDVTAAVLVWKLPNDEIAIEPHFWLPEDNLDDRSRRDRVPYTSYVPRWLSVTNGNTIERQYIRPAVRDMARQWKVKSICFDPWQAHEMMQNLQDDDHLQCIKVPQSGFSLLSSPTKYLQGKILERRVRHDRNPLMTVMVSNSIVKEDENSNVKLSKKRSRGRIDGCQALVTALAVINTDQLVRPQVFFLGGR